MMNRNTIKITDFTIPELDIFVRASEPQLLHYYEPETGIFLAESPRVTLRALAAGYQPLAMVMTEDDAGQEEGETAEVLALCPEVPVYVSDFDTLKKELGFPLSRGMLCAMRRKVLPAVEDVVKGARRIAVLDDVVNPTNVGAIMRSAAAMKIDAILLTRECSDPLYRRAVRVSMGTAFQIPWTIIGAEGWHAYGGPEANPKYRAEAANWPEQLRKLGFATAAMALKTDSVPIDDEKLMAEEKLAIVLGNEGNGLKDEIIAACDYTVLIPMAPGIDSLNVAAASAVAFWQLTR